MNLNPRALREALIEISIGAGKEIMAIYDGDHGVEIKEDNSPLTLADKAAHTYILNALNQRYPQIPVISEEGRMPDASERAEMPVFFLVDPLDGTKEFIKRNGEFTVNIALVQGDAPVVGAVHVPVQGKTYAGGKGQGCVLVTDSERKHIVVDGQPNHQNIRVSSSRSHPSGDLETFLSSLPGITPMPLGSSLKFCLIAEGKVDFYPRFGPLSEWDTAAAHAVLEGAGGKVTGLDGQPLRYNKPKMKHMGLLAISTEALFEDLIARMPEVEIIDDRA